jgi:hypothetical protein
MRGEKPMSAWHACVRLWAFGSAAWLAFWVWNATQCTKAAAGILLCPTASGEGVSPTTYMHLALTVLGPPLVTMAAGLLLFRWTVRDAGNDPKMPDGSS